ncbi:hypothetical protein [Azospirillum agricola]|nr:hypothetical protein [Azospirillum agricola]SMH62812.1 hypothetical protein SAMN02982994_6635 [Azospirillum lipoferum]
MVMINDLKRRNPLDPGRSTVVEFSAGNLAIVLVQVRAMRG